MRRIVASALLVSLALAVPARAQPGAAVEAAGALQGDPVYVHPREADRLTVPEQGRVRLQIVRSALGRVRVAVVPEEVAARSGGVEGFAHQVDNALGAPGTLIVAAGPAYFVVTSYRDSDAAASALRRSVNARDDDRLVDELVPAIRRIARVDPGPADDPRPSSPTDVPNADDFLDDVGDTLRLGVLIVAAAVALPFILGAALLVARARRRRAREEEVQEAGEQSGDTELIALGDEIRSLDLDTSMPNANRAALTEYEQAIAYYDQANDLLLGDATAYQVEQARAAIAAGRRHVAATRERLG